MSRRARRGLAAEIRRFIRANLSSAIASGLEYVLVTGLVLAGTHYLAAAAVGAVTGAFTDFSLKRHWAFDRSVKGAVHHEGLRYLAVSGASLVLNLAVAYALVDGLRLPPVPGVIAASLVVGIVWNYPLHRCYVFRTAGQQPTAVASPLPASAHAASRGSEPVLGARGCPPPAHPAAHPRCAASRGSE